MNKSIYRPDIDGLRAYAILIVLFFHAFPSFLPGGYVGVDVFFVISGFLITRIIHTECSQGSFSLKLFYFKRIKRIFPALNIVLLAVLVAGWLLLTPQEYKNLGKHIFGGAAFISNILLWKESGYFDVSAELKPLLHLWSLGIEEQFYFVWPLIISFLTFKKIRIRISLVLICLLSLILNLFFIYSHPTITFFLPITRVWELAIGGILALSIPPDKSFKLSIRLQNIAAIFGTLLIAFSAIYFDSKSLFPGWRAMLPVWGTVLLICSRESFLNTRLLSSRLMIGIGLISYPLYLWHWPLISFGNILYPTSGHSRELIFIKALAVALSVVLAWLTYTLIEKPIRRTISFKLIYFHAFSLLVIGLVGLIIYFSNGFPKRLDSKKAILESMKSFDESKKGPRFIECQNKFIKAELCAFSSGSPEVAIIGDSHANHLFPALKEYYRKRNLGVLVLAKSGTLPFSGISSLRNPTTSNDDVIEYVLKENKITTVFLAGFWQNYFEEKGAYIAFHEYKNKIRDEKNLKTNEQKAIFLQGLERTLIKLKEAGKKIIFVYDIPNLPFYLSTCTPRPFKHDFSKNCGIEKEIFSNVQSRYKSEVAPILNRHSITILDPSERICDGTFCSAIKNGKFIYTDEHHLSVHGSMWLLENMSF